MPRSLFARASRVVLILASFAGAAHAQANLSTQGFGFPPGQLSTRAWGTGGSIADIDPLSPVNPASVALHTTRIVVFQLEPEYRTLKSPSGTEQTTIARYPNVFVAFPVGRGWVVSAGGSTLLDRTSTTQFNTTQILPSGPDTVPMHTQSRIDGAMSDLRLAGAYTVTPWLRFGVGLHAITGHNLVEITQSFTDSVQFSAFTQSLIVDFQGLAGSAGVQLSSKSWGLGLDGRVGGGLRASVEDTVLSHAKVPSRFGATLAFTGITNATFAVRTAYDGWSALNGLGTADAQAVNAWDSSIGAEIPGPRIGSRVLVLRGGFRTRTLPFEARDLLGVEHKVSETSGTGGFGTSFAGGRVLFDFATIYANRSADLPAKEHAWTLSFGISLRP